VWVEWQYHQQWRRRRRRRRNTGSAKSSSFWFSMPLLSTLSSSIDLFNSLSVPLFLFFIISISQSLLLSLLLFCSTDFFFFLKKNKNRSWIRALCFTPWMASPSSSQCNTFPFFSGFHSISFFLCLSIAKVSIFNPRMLVMPNGEISVPICLFFLLFLLFSPCLLIL